MVCKYISIQARHATTPYFYCHQTELCAYVLATCAKIEVSYGAATTDVLLFTGVHANVHRHLGMFMTERNYNSSSPICTKKSIIRYYNSMQTLQYIRYNIEACINYFHSLNCKQMQFQHSNTCSQL